MKILFLNTHDISGGAAIAAYRLLKGVQQEEIEAQMLVQFKKSDDSSIISRVSKWQKTISLIRPFLDGFPVRRYKNRKMNLFSPAVLKDSIYEKIKEIDPDIVHLHWIAGGFVRIESLARIDKPIVWTLHDMWAFTGGCHYNETCEKYENHCGACPILQSNQENDLSCKIWRRKERTWKNLDLTVIAPSSWMGECAKKSALFSEARIKVIPNGIDLNHFKSIDKDVARNILNLPKNKKLLLFGAINALSDKRKGFPLLKEALKKYFSREWKDIELVVFGSSRPGKEEIFNFKTHYLGQLHDEISLVLAYSASDIMIVPSMQDNLPNTVVESLACGTPVIAFDIGGIPDMVIHKENGYLSKPFDTSDLADGIKWLLEDKERWDILSQNARKKAEREFDINKVASRYIKVYQDILRKNKNQ